MASVKQTILNTLNDDATLTAIVTGEFLDADNLPFDGLTQDNLQTTVNNVTILCQGVLRWKSENPMRGPESAVRRFLEIYIYDDPTNGFDNIDAAKRRIWALLHQKRFAGVDSYGLCWTIWVGDVGESYDDVLRANMDRMRIQVDLTRVTT